ncbi:MULTISPECIES: SRPBCC family protein [Nitrosospira]|uniref:SRPBCC family protein n=1 Tax=Nitrosospira TaxID=35798 RepID=UPI0004682292|nr:MULTISPECIES: SRPBCC family protein [Nitrosospira]SCX40827.1 Polyketide cyclase / dehydrase and lipid transport [Nitrosospira sp. Nsp1]
MNKFQGTFAAILLNLVLGDSAWAQEETQPGREKVQALHPVKQALEPHDKNIRVDVRNDGDQITIDVNFVVPVAPQKVWAVLTDFENIPQFNPGILSSRITGRTGNHCHVAQKSITKYGFIVFSFESVREIKLVPFERIHERMISGNMRKMEETTELLPERGQTRIIYRAVLVPGVWVPPMVGDVFVKQEAREQFQTLIDEIIRRERVKTVSR